MVRIQEVDSVKQKHPHKLPVVQLKGYDSTHLLNRNSLKVASRNKPHSDTSTDGLQELQYNTLKILKDLINFLLTNLPCVQEPAFTHGSMKAT